MHSQRPGRGEPPPQPAKVSWHWDDDGSLIISGRLSPEERALVVKALEVAADNDGGEDVVALTWETSA